MKGYPKLVFALLAFVLSGCGSLSNFREIRDIGPSIFVAGTAESVRDAAVVAMEERRLVSPQFEKIENGVVVYAEQSSMSALVFNSYGGFGKVTIKGGNRSGNSMVEVSAITRSRIPNEPVGPGDALKGQNFNDPKIAISILDRINEITKKKMQ